MQSIFFMLALAGLVASQTVSEYSDGQPQASTEAVTVPAGYVASSSFPVIATTTSSTTSFVTIESIAAVSSQVPTSASVEATSQVPAVFTSTTSTVTFTLSGTGTTSSTVIAFGTVHSPGCPTAFTLANSTVTTKLPAISPQISGPSVLTSAVSTTLATSSVVAPLSNSLATSPLTLAPATPSTTFIANTLVSPVATSTSTNPPYVNGGARLGGAVRADAILLGLGLGLFVMAMF